MIKLKTKELHFDESSPHLHIVGVPVKENCKTGMNKQVGKSDVFNVESLKDILENLKQQPLSKNNLIISSDKKDKLLEYIKDIQMNNKTFKSLSNYNLSLENIKKDLDDNYKTIRTLTNDNEDLKIKLEEKESLLAVAKNRIKELNKKIIELESKVESWKQRFNKIVDFISERVKGFFGNILKNKYKDVADDLRENNIITEKEYKKIYDLPIRKEYKEDKKINADFEL